MDTILWRFIPHPGHEFCRLYQEDADWHLQGTAAFSHEQKPCLLSYHLLCDATWHTQSATIEGWVGRTEINLHIQVDEAQRWWLNAIEVPEVSGCTDLDLNFSPCTNTLPIRRVSLAVGESANVKAAWLRFPSLMLEPLDQRYTRLEEGIYRYESGGGRFVADLQVNYAGLVTDYPGVWQAESGLAQ